MAKRKRTNGVIMIYKTLCRKLQIQSPTNKVDCQDIADILLKVALNNINQPIKKRKTLNATLKINTPMLIY
jgi:hypothetical protein